MMQREAFRQDWVRRGLSETEWEKTISLLERLENTLRTTGTTDGLDALDTVGLDRLIAGLAEEDKADWPAFAGLFRYFRAVGRKDLQIRITQYTGPDGVIPAILGRLRDQLGAEIADEVLPESAIPSLATPPETYPAFTSRFIRRLKDRCPKAMLEPVLAGNNHGIPEAAFAGERDAYARAPDLETYLEDLHRRQVAELQRHCDAGTVWFEQEITQEVVDWVKNDPEIQSARLDRDRLMVTKIPYDTKRMLEETDPRIRRYHTCHCPFVREAIRTGDPTIDTDWCLCSAGFVKYQFEVLFGRPLHAEMLESVLQGDDRCRFAINVAGIPLRRRSG